MTVQEPTNSVLFPKCRISGLQVVMKGIKVFGKKKKNIEKIHCQLFEKKLGKRLNLGPTMRIVFKVSFLNFKSLFFKIRENILKSQLFMTTSVSKSLI